MTDDNSPRPVFDPAIPTDDRALLAAAPERLTPASLPAPPPARASAATILGRAIWIPLFAFFYGVLPGGWLRVLFLTSLDDDDLSGGASRWGRTAVAAMMITPAVQIVLILLGRGELAALLAAGSFVAWTVGALRHLREPASSRAAREHHGRYLLPADFDRPAARLLVRAQRAIDTVLASRAHGAGLLDDVNNAVVLPRQEWAIACALAEHTRLRRDRRAQRPELLTAPVRELLEPQRRALELSVRAITERVEALEEYARRARSADDAYHEWQVLRRLPEQNARYQDLLARTVGHDLARDEIRRLADDARRAENALRDSIRSALRTGRFLTEIPA
ncbi:hypothetical protein Arub01_15630 [Actinomadura rubrobrunea]|uniref:Uncharacterized protein n=1 Tax=Actinomadura rubrobrunea TaxID=115335 RepID=A0A9W6UTZ9_9ACTN|nr:hypothetical protein [Actinomadura rubrobrunea]GLW63319.1 hypothetical protein Arub01_15630 [Actinomadura rubrobrunea]